MNLQVPDELISAYFDGEVTPDERAEMERLLESSSELRQQLDETSKLSALLHSFPREAAPRDLTANVRKLVEAAALPTSAPAATATPRNWRREWTAFGAGILATMASLLALVAINRSPLLQKSDQDRKEQFAAHTTLTAPQAEKESLGRFSKVAMREAHPESIVNRSRVESPMPPPHEAASSLHENTLSDVAADSVMSAPANSAARSKDKSDWVDGAVADGVVASSDALGVTPENNFDSVMNQVDLSATSIQSQTQGEFLWSLANGDVVVSKIADPSNTVAVVDLTVVDMERGAEELKVLLQKRSVQQIDQNEGSPAQKRLESKELADQQQSSDVKEAARSDEFQVFYVRAPGDQLAGTIDDLIKNHPDLYRNWTPQAPIELPVPAVATAETLAAKPYTNRTLRSSNKYNEEQRDAVEKPEEVNVEADLAVNFLVARNNLTIANGDRNFYYQGNTLGIPNEAFDTDATSKRKAESAAPSAGALVDNRETSPPDTDRTAGANNDSYFRVSRENMLQLGQQLSLARQNSALPKLTNSIQNLNINTAAKSQQALGVNNDRSSKLVRMLIVLKSEQLPAVSPP